MPHFGLDYSFVNNVGTLQTDALFLTRSIYDKKKDDHTQFFNDAWLTWNTATIQMFFFVPIKIQQLKRYFWRKNIVFLKSITLGLN